MNVIQSLFPSRIITIYWAAKQRVCVRLAREPGRLPTDFLQTLFPKPSPLVSSLSLKQNTSCILPSPLPQLLGDATDHLLLTSLFNLLQYLSPQLEQYPLLTQRRCHSEQQVDWRQIHTSLLLLSCNYLHYYPDLCSWKPSVVSLSSPAPAPMVHKDLLQHYITQLIPLTKNPNSESSSFYPCEHTSWTVQENRTQHTVIIVFENAKKK